MSEIQTLRTPTHHGVDHALEIIALLANSGKPMSISDISREIGITRATAYTIVNSLLNHNYIEEIPSGKKYIIGYSFYNIGSLYRYQYPFLGTMEHYLIPLYQKRGIRLNVSLLKPNATTLIVLTIDSSQLSPLSHGSSIMAHASASGRILLAYQSEATRKEIYSQIKFISYTPYTVTKPIKLEEEFSKIRTQGYAISVDELVPYRGSIAVPIFDKTGAIIAAVAFAGDSRTLAENQETLVADLINVSADISVALGYNSIPF